MVFSNFLIRSLFSSSSLFRADCSHVLKFSSLFRAVNCPKGARKLENTRSEPLQTDLWTRSKQTARKALGNLRTRSKPLERD